MASFSKLYNIEARMTDPRSYSSSFFFCVVYFVSYVSNVANVTELTILDFPFGLS
jgi:hypothetical protein